MSITTPQQVTKIPLVASSTVDRLQASKLLKVSVRTIDRYIKSGKVPAYQKNGRIWLKKSDVLELGKGTLVMKNSFATENHSPVRATGTRTAPSVQEITAAYQNASSNDNSDVLFYKDLYEEAQKRLNEYQSKLEQSNSRMSELESQIIRLNSQSSTMVSQPIVSRQIERIEVSKDDKIELELLKKDLVEKEKNFAELKSLFDKEKANKTVFALLTYVLLALQPVFWYFLR